MSVTVAKADENPENTIEGSTRTETDTPEHVVFVDDEPKVCRAVRRMLERAGMHVTCLGSAEQSLSHLDKERCDLLITDVRLPGQNGIDLLMTVRSFSLGCL